MKHTTRAISTLAVTVLCLLPVVSGRAAESPGARTFTLEETTIAEINAALDAGLLTCQRLTELYLNRIAAYDAGGPRLNSIITVNPKALTTAAALDEERRRRGPRSPLHCIPVLIKDNIDTVDMPTTNGSVILKDSMPPDDAYLTKALRDAGAVIIGKASMGEFAGGSYNTVRGQVVNPYHLKRNTGGSSAGSGASIAANLAVVAVGTDTSTSVRAPSAFNGLAGLRPTTGLISRDGIAPKNLLFDTAGPMARTVTDMAILLSAIAGPDRHDPLGFNARVYENHPMFKGKGPLTAFSNVKGAPRGIDYTQFLKKGSLKGARIGVARDYWGGDPEIVALGEAAIAKLKELGAVIVDPVKVQTEQYVSNIRELADYRFREDWEAYLATLGPAVPKTVAEFLKIYDTDVKRSPLPLEDSVHRLLTNSLTKSSADPAYQNLVNATLPANTKSKLAILDAQRLDALVFPYSATFAAVINNPAFKLDDPTWQTFPRTPSPSSFAPYSSIGFPMIVVPMGFGTQGLPMAISLMARPYQEGKLIGYAYDYEQATRHRRPSPLVPPLPGETIRAGDERSTK
jgi:amidase